jgi:FMN phosphatase YigB (HAD superfamily)
MSEVADVVFLFDVDDTLLDNDRIQADIREHIRHAHGKVAGESYWNIFEALRGELGYADYLGALERYRLEDLHDPRLLSVANWMLDYPFADRLYSGALDAVRHVGQWGPVVILSDGDAVFQPRKVDRSGLWRLFDGRVLIYVHKEKELADVERWFPAHHYVLIDDKLHILDAVKSLWRDRVTTIFARQGHYALDAAALAGLSPADVNLSAIADLQRHDFSALKIGAGRKPGP